MPTILTHQQRLPKYSSRRTWGWTPWRANRRGVWQASSGPASLWGSLELTWLLHGMQKLCSSRATIICFGWVARSSRRAKETSLEATGVETIIKYGAFEPVVVGLGVQRSDPGWEFTPHDEHPLVGSKFLYLIVQKPRQIDAVRLRLRVAAEVETRQGLLSARTRHQDRERLSTVICVD